MQVWVSNERVVKEALTVISDAYGQEQVEKIIMKLLRVYDTHAKHSGGWHNIFKYTKAKFSKELNSNG